jgi:hypothetical protein
MIPPFSDFSTTSSRSLHFGCAAKLFALIAALIASEILAASPFVRAKGRTIWLTGILKREQNFTVFVTPGEGDYFSPMNLSPGLRRDNIQLVSASLNPPAAVLRVFQKEYVIELERLEAATHSATDDPRSPQPFGCLVRGMSLNQYLDLYMLLTRRTIFQDAHIRDPTLDAFAEGSLTNVVRAVEQAARKNGLILTNYSDNFCLLLPEKGKIPDLSSVPTITVETKTTAEEQVAAGAISVQGMPFDQFLRLFEMYSGRKVLRDRSLPAIDCTLKPQTDLTRAEVVHAFVLFLAVNGYKTEQFPDGTVKLTRR